MDIRDFIHSIRTALDNTYLGAIASFVAGVWAFIRLTYPVLSEWIASRHAAQEKPIREDLSFEKMWRLLAQTSIDNDEKWDEERADLRAEIIDLKRQISKMGDKDAK